MNARELITAHLRPMSDASALAETEFQLAVVQGAPELGAEAVAGCGQGLDHYGGEHIIAAALLRELPRGYEHRVSLAITDRRTIVNGWSSIKGGYNELRFSIPHPALARVEVKQGMLSNCVKLFTHDGQERQLIFPAATQMLGQLYQAMAYVHPQARVAPPIALPQPSADDPAAARAAEAALWRLDPQASRALAHVDQLTRGGQIDAASGYDFVCRMLLTHRSAMGGPGHNGQAWISAMSAKDLGHTFTNIFGAPTQYQVGQDGWAWHEFRLDPQRDPLGGALTALGVAAYVGLGVGFSPGRAIAHQMMKRTPITSIRVGIRDANACSMYLVQGPKGGLEHSDANMAHRLHQALIHSAYKVLDRRAVLGWTVDYHQLFA